MLDQAVPPSAGAGGPQVSTTQGASMNDETLNMSIRKFLKSVGVNAQLAIEKAVREASAGGRLPTAPLPASMTLRIDGLALEVRFDGEIRAD